MEGFDDSKILSGLDFMRRGREAIFSTSSHHSRKGSEQRDNSGPEGRGSGVVMKLK
jgi:hypothetical protein